MNSYQKLFLIFTTFLLIGCVAPGTTFEEVSDVKLNEAIRIIKTTELDKPIEKTRKEAVLMVENIIEKSMPAAVEWCEANNIPKARCKWKFNYLDDDMFNAFASGRNQITYTKGLMNGVASEEEVAFVIAHEIGHHIGNHIANSQRNIMLGSLAGRILGTVIEGSDELISQTTDLGARFGSLFYSRDQEKEADYFSLVILNKSGFDLIKARDVIIRMAQQSERSERSGFFDTHPTGPERLARFNQTYSEFLKNQLN
ncbi:M48 family metallopeptidase [SAR86 cluster bacterium]|nr:M48 family metallopeptidase [SAR86 cluster bacterium]